MVATSELATLFDLNLNCNGVAELQNPAARIHSSDNERTRNIKIRYYSLPDVS